MQIPAYVQAMWSEFSQLMGGISEDRFYEAFGFGDSAEMAEQLGHLVVAGVKRATAGSVWSYESSGKAIPKPGDLSVVTDGQDRPLCIIETTQVDVMPFDEVPAEFAATEGEGDGSLEYWCRAHTEYFTRECQRSARTFDGSLLLACERFRVVYPLAVDSAA